MPTRLQIHIGNHLETLGKALSRQLHSHARTLRPDPLHPTVILVQSRGMQQWVSMTLARHSGICANFEFPFPNAFLERAYDQVVGPLPENSPYDKQCLTFRVMALLKEMAGQESFAMIRSYLTGAESELKRYQLANKISDIYDQYLVFRPELLKQWEKGGGLDEGPHHRWQALLWRRLTADIGQPHRADLQQVLVQKLLDDRIAVDGLPDHVSVFGISHLPPFHLQVLEAMAHRIPVDLYLLNPCREYWADIASDRQLSKARARAEQMEIEFGDLHFDRGNRLLASWGLQGRQFFGLTHQLDGRFIESFADNPVHGLLTRIQQDILELGDPAGRVHAGESVPPDGSIRIHACHSALREVEVLHDQLLEIMEADPEIHPGDVMVMTPDISVYAPYIHAVFGSGGMGRDQSIAYTVADQGLQRESQFVDGFLRLLQLRNSRLEATRILDLLELQPVRERFGIAAADLPLLARWVGEAGIRWGWDAPDRKNRGLPGFPENTWQTGLDRLLMGYAVLQEENRLCSGVLPHEGIEGGQADLLGRLVRFATALYGELQKIPSSASPAQWADILAEFMDKLLFADDQSARDRQVVRLAMEKIRSLETEGVLSESYSFEIVNAHLGDALSQRLPGTGFMAGGVTFCALLPMRSIPAKVICILGLQHDAFPRDLHEPGFHLMAASPRPGDRSKRDDDKYLFLEALLSARSIFYLSYIGRDIQDNSIRPPSVLVHELLEYLTEGMGIEEEKLVTVHPLQGFARPYFDGSDDRLFSYSLENLEACRQLAAQTPSPAKFLPTPLPPPEPAMGHVTVADLIRFFQHPIRFLAERRLGIYLRREPEIARDRESFHPDALERFFIGQTILDTRIRNESTKSSFETARAAGQLPHGTVGEVVHDEIEDEVVRFVSELDLLLPKEKPRDLVVRLEKGPVRIEGHIDNLFKEVRLVYRLARIRPQDMVMLFINHLILQETSQQADDIPDESILVGKDEVLRLGAMENAGDLLGEMAELYWRGLQFPLPLFPRSSHAYAIHMIEKNAGEQKALAAAWKEWHGGYAHDGECLDPYIRLCVAETDPFQKSFQDLALQIYTPLLAAMELRALK